MAQKVPEIEAPALALRHCSVDDYCRAVQNCRHNPFWFYQDTSRVFGNFRKPFQDASGRWWLRVRQGFAWPADLLTPFSPAAPPRYRHTFLAYQHIVPEGAPANSALFVNVLSLSGFSAGSLNAKKRNKVRQGLKACDVSLLASLDAGVVRQLTAAWNSLVARTGWKAPLTERQITEKFAELLDLPGTSILVATDRASGSLAGFFISKIFGDTASVDTIAANSDFLPARPNDALMFTWLRCAQAVAGVTQANYAIKSAATKLEEFKISLGFVPQRFPAFLQARPGVLPAIRLLSPTMYKRLTGQVYWDEERPNPEEAPTPAAG